MNRSERSRGERIIEVIIFAVYLAALIYFLFFAEMFGRGGGAGGSHNFIPFHEIRRYILYADRIGAYLVAMNLGGNIIGFMPFGMFLPVVLPERPHGITVILLGALFSSIVEFSQYVTQMGNCDVDDIILNTIGVILGWIVYWIAHTIRRKSRQKIRR